MSRETAEKFCVPFWSDVGPTIPKRQVRDLFYLREVRVYFKVYWGNTWQCNVKVIVTISYSDGTVTYLLVDTDPYEPSTYEHKRKTRNFFILPECLRHGKITCVRFCYVVHFEERSIPSQHSYFLFDGRDLSKTQEHLNREVTHHNLHDNTYITRELDPDLLQRDSDWASNNIPSLNLKPIFTKGQTRSPEHPKQYIHAQLDKVIHNKKLSPDQEHTVKICVDDIDDTDFINHIIHAHEQGVKVQCVVDWRKMFLTNGENFARLKRCGIELLGVACMPNENPLLEVDPDMHTKFIIFDMEDAIMGSFNVTFEHWPDNWEAGMTLTSQAACRLLDNFFQSIRGGMVQKYEINPRAPFNLLYTYGRHRTRDSYNSNYRPNRAIIQEISRAQRSIRVVLFLMGEMIDEGNNVVNTLINAKNRGVDIQILLNGHIVRIGPNDQPFTMADELKRPVIPAVSRLQSAGINVYLVYGKFDQKIPYCPIHSKYCIIDDHIVIDGSFNWYNTSLFSHDMVAVVDDVNVARPYVDEFHQIMREFRIFKGNKLISS